MEATEGYNEERLTWREEEMLRCGPVSPEEARDILVRFCHSHFRGRLGDNAKEVARISIPADPKRDDDLRLSAFISQAALAMKDREQIRQEAMLEERAACIAACKELGGPFDDGEAVEEVLNRRGNAPRQFTLLAEAFNEVTRLKAKLRDVHDRLRSVGLLTDELDLR